MDPELEAWLRDLWAQRGLPFSNVNLKQAWLIPSALAMANPDGTAPGWWVEKEGKVVVALPGPPRELKPMWRDHVLPRLRQRGIGLDRAVTTLHLVGIGESALVDVVGTDLLENENPRMATYARADFVDLRVSAVSEGDRTADDLVAEAVAGLSPRLDPYAFARDDDDWTRRAHAAAGGSLDRAGRVGTGGYLGLLLGGAPFVRGSRATSRRHRPVAPGDRGARHAWARRSAWVSWHTSPATTCGSTIALDIEGDTRRGQPHGLPRRRCGPAPFSQCRHR